MPTATASILTVTLQNSNALEVPGCFNVAGIFNFISNAYSLYDLNDLFAQPCGELPFIQSAVFVSATGFIPSGTSVFGSPPVTEAACSIENDFVQLTGSVLPGSTATCALMANTVGCNGIVATNSIVFNLVCLPLSPSLLEVDQTDSVPSAANTANVASVANVAKAPTFTSSAAAIFPAFARAPSAKASNRARNTIFRA